MSKIKNGENCQKIAKIHYVKILQDIPLHLKIFKK